MISTKHTTINNLAYGRSMPRLSFSIKKSSKVAFGRTPNIGGILIGYGTSNLVLILKQICISVIF